MEAAGLIFAALNLVCFLLIYHKCQIKFYLLHLKQAQGYSSDQGAAFEVFFEKTRHFAGEDATSFQVQLKEQEDGLWLWEVSGSKPDERVIEIADAVKEGLTIKEMKQRTGFTKSQIETCKKKAKEQGLSKIIVNFRFPIPIEN